MRGLSLGPYHLLDEIGCGATGRVFRARVSDGTSGLEPDSIVALKVIHSHLSDTSGFFQRYLREADIGRSVQHENVVRTYLADAVIHEGVQQSFLVMEYVDGQTLRELLGEHEQVPEELCRHIGREVARGLMAIHDAGVVHRDLKPENVLITQDNVVKVMDLGLAQIQEEAIRLSQTGAFVGSPMYAAPEQFQGGEALDGRADLHALGAMLFELATGKHVCAQQNIAGVIRQILEETPPRVGRINPQLSAFFEEVVHTLLAKRRDHRFADAATLLRVLEEGESSTWWQERSQVLRRSTRRPLRRVRIPRETALYGRNAELKLLERAYEQACAGQGQVLLIEGEAGVGKSRLVDEFVARMVERGEDLNFLFGDYPPGGAATAAGALSTAYREHFGTHGMEQTLRAYLAPTPVLVPAFAAVLRGDAAPPDQEPLTKTSLQAVFVHATRALAAERPSIILIDDLHFAPREGRALFAALALAVPEHRVLLIGTARPGLLPEWSAELVRLAHTTCMKLPRLGAKDLALLLKETFRSEGLAQQLGLKIAEMSDGNPFFVFEIVQGLRDSQFVTQTENGSWVGTRTIEALPVPSSVQDLIHARLAALDEEDRELLDVASCCGYEFDGRVLAAVAHRSLIPVLRQLTRLERKHHLVRSVGSRFLFDHQQIQEALRAVLPPLLAREYHAAIGDALASVDTEESSVACPVRGAIAIELCQHFLKGGRGEDALEHLPAALDHLEAGYLHAPAAELADLALGTPDLLKGAQRVEMLLRQTQRLHLLAFRGQEEAAIEEAAAVVGEIGRPDLEGSVHRAHGHLCVATARYDEARRHFERALEIAEASGDRRTMAHATAALGAALSKIAQQDQAGRLLQRALELSRAAGDRASEAAAEGSLGLLSLDASRYEEARRHLLRQLEIAQELRIPRTQAIALGNLGIICAEQGKPDEAQMYFERKLELSRDVGDREGEAVAAANLGMVFVTLGSYEDARTQYEQTRALAREIGAADGEAHAEGNLGVVCFDLCRYADALDHYERQLEITRRTGDRYGEGNALVNLGRLQTVLGQIEDARGTIDEALRLVREVGMPRVEGFALHALAALAEEQGEPAEAQRLYGGALAIQRRIGAQEAVAETLVALGHLEAEHGDTARAVKHLEEALAISIEVETPGTRYLATVQRMRLPGGDVAPVLDALDELEQSVAPAVRMQGRWALYRSTGEIEHAQRARRVLERAVENAPPELRQSMTRRVALHRALWSATEIDAPS